MEKRKANIIIGKSGGNAGGKNPVTYKVSLPTKWVKEMELGTEQSKEIEMHFDGTKIIITKKQTPVQFAMTAIGFGSDVKKLSYYDDYKLCTVIYADFTSQMLEIENHTDNIVKTAFGRNEIPDWNEFIDFLKERCVPESRDGIKDYLDEIGVVDYDPLEIVRVTKGRMAEDAQWLEVEDLCQ